MGPGRVWVGTGALLLGLMALPVRAIPVPLAEQEMQLMAIRRQLNRSQPMPQLVEQAARLLLGRPYLAQAAGDKGAEGAQEPLAARLDAFDCVTYVEASLAIARVVSRGATDWKAYQRELESLRYRAGQRRQYASRLHYFSEWLADNARRGHVMELSRSLGGESDARLINFMTTHRASYGKLANPQVFAQIEQIEATLSETPRWVIPKNRFSAIVPVLLSGDVVAFATRIKGLDVAHVGIVTRRADGSVHLLHAPEPHMVIQESQASLVDYLTAEKLYTGVMVARPLTP